MRIDRADSESELLGPPISKREIVQVVAGDFEVRLAHTPAEKSATISPTSTIGDCVHHTRR